MNGVLHYAVGRAMGSSMRNIPLESIWGAVTTIFAAASNTTELGRSLLELSNKLHGQELSTHFPSSSLKCPTIIPTCISRV